MPDNCRGKNCPSFVKKGRAYCDRCLKERDLKKRLREAETDRTRAEMKRNECQIENRKLKTKISEFDPGSQTHKEKWPYSVKIRGENYFCNRVLMQALLDFSAKHPEAIKFTYEVRR